jgi:hypothetical protein
LTGLPGIHTGPRPRAEHRWPCRARGPENTYFA